MEHLFSCLHLLVFSHQHLLWDEQPHQWQQVELDQLFRPLRRDVKQRDRLLCSRDHQHQNNPVHTHAMTLQYNHRLHLRVTYNFSYLRMPFSTKDNHQASTSTKLWTPQLETLGERLLQTGLQCNYDLTSPHKEKHNRFLRHIFLI